MLLLYNSIDSNVADMMSVCVCFLFQMMVRIGKGMRFIGFQ